MDGIRPVGRTKEQFELTVGISYHYLRIKLFLPL